MNIQPRSLHGTLVPIILSLLAAGEARAWNAEVRIVNKSEHVRLAFRPSRSTFDYYMEAIAEFDRNWCHLNVSCPDEIYIEPDGGRTSWQVKVANIRPDYMTLEIGFALIGAEGHPKEGIWKGVGFRFAFASENDDKYRDWGTPIPVGQLDFIRFLVKSNLGADGTLQEGEPGEHTRVEYHLKDGSVIYDENY